MIILEIFVVGILDCFRVVVIVVVFRVGVGMLLNWLRKELMVVCLVVVMMMLDMVILLVCE